MIDNGLIFHGPFQTDENTENPHKNGDIKPAENGVTTGNGEVADKKTD